MKDIAGTTFMSFLLLASIVALSGCGKSGLSDSGIDKKAAIACQSLFDQGKIIGAEEICAKAADSYGDIQYNEADTVRFEAAIATISSVLLNMPADAQSNGLNTLGDVFRAFGVTASGRVPYGSKKIALPRTLPASSPRGGVLQDFTAGKIRPALEKSIAYLSKISKEVNAQWKEPFGSKQVVSDYGDVLALRAAARYMLGAILMENSYNLDADIRQAVNKKINIQAFLNSNPGFLGMKASQDFIGGRDLLSDAADDVLAAIDWMQSEAGQPSSSHLISLGRSTAGQIKEAKRNVSDFKCSLTSTKTIFDRNGAQVGTLDLTKFFAGVDFGTMLPNASSDMFPDPTFGGIWTDYAGGRYDPNNKAARKNMHH